MPATKTDLTKVAEEKELTAEELKAESDRVQEIKDKQDEEKRKAKELGSTSMEGEKTYSKTEVESLIRKILAEKNSKDDEEDELFNKKTVRLSRFQNKFVIAFKNTNTDPYFPENIIHAFDVWSDQEKRPVAWVTCIFDDKSELNIQLYTIITKSIKVECELVERKKIDKSYSNGKTEVMGEVKEYNRMGTGVMTKMKVEQHEERFVLKLPVTGEIIEVGKEVINW